MNVADMRATFCFVHVHLISALGDIGGFRHDDITKVPALGKSLSPMFNTSVSLDFAQAKPEIMVASGNGKVHGALSENGGLSWQLFKSEPEGTRGNGKIAISVDGKTIIWKLKRGVQWHDGTDTLTLSGTLDAIPMLSVALTVRQASASEWTTLLTTAQPMFDAGVETSTDAALTDLNAMTTASGDRWTFKVTNDLGALEVAHTSDAVGGNAWSSREPFRFDTLGTLTTFGSGTATVVAFAIHDPKSAVALRVTVGAGQPIDAPLVAVTANDGTVNYAAAQAFSEIDTSSVVLIDASGNVVRQLARQA